MRNGVDTSPCTNPGVTRRSALYAGGLSFLSALAGGIDLVQAASDESARQYRKLLWIWPDGGPSSHETFDPKPDASSSIRGPFPAIASSLDGVQVSSVFPQMARRMHELILYRARLAEPGPLEHLSQIAHVLRRRPSGKTLLTDLADHSRNLPPLYAEAPNVIRGADYRKRSFSVQHMLEATWNDETKRFTGIRIPRAEDPQRLLTRRDLLRRLNDLGRENAPSMQERAERAIELSVRGLDIATKLPERDLERYGGSKHPSSVGILTAREMIRQEFVSVVLYRDGYNALIPHSGWDHHESIKECMSYMCPPFDQALSQLIEDHDRGLLGDDVLIVYGAEFGRTPKVTDGYGGRDHHGIHCGWMKGPGARCGSVYGRTDRSGEAALEGTVTNDEWAAIIRRIITRSSD